jgi:hypothetical protein
MITASPNRSALISLAAAAAAAIAAMSLPMCAQVATDMAAVGETFATEFRRVHCDVSPAQVMITWLPVVISGVVVVMRTTAAAGTARFIAAAMLVGFVIVAGISIGLLYLPGAAAMVVAARAGHLERRAATSRAVQQQFG